MPDERDLPFACLLLQLTSHRGNWAQHAFLAPASPEKCYPTRVTVTRIHLLPVFRYLLARRYDLLAGPPFRFVELAHPRQGVGGRVQAQLLLRGSELSLARRQGSEV